MLELQIFYTLVGLIVGSFLNVCIYRIPLGESVILPASHCPHCDAHVRAYDNIPLLSYLWLRGRCRSCGETISLQYPAVEVLTAFSFWLCATWWEFSPPTFVNSLLLCILIVLIFIDYHHQILPNVITLPGTLLGVMLSPFQDPSVYDDVFSRMIASGLGDTDRLLPWAGSLLGAFTASGTLFLVAFGYEFIRKRQGLGLGDVKMMACVGAFLGWRLAFLTVFAGSLLGALLGVSLILFRGGNLQVKLPFGTFLGTAAAIAIFGGIPFLEWYTPNP